MGHGVYSSLTRTERATNLGYFSKPKEEIFEQRQINNAMNPYGVKLRESRDSEEHPCTIPIILALDVTGSMGTVPHYLVKNGLPNIMEGIIASGIPDPQLLFMGIGDHECDESPLQIGQFESSDELLDKWLTTVYLEGGGGGNYGESYMLAWYFAAMHTSTDSFEKRDKKGYLFTVGDEPVLKAIPKNDLKNIMGDGQYSNYKANDLLEIAKKSYEVYHIHINETYSGSRQSVKDEWKQLLSENLIIAQSSEEVPEIVKKIVVSGKEEQKTVEGPRNKKIIL